MPRKSIGEAAMTDAERDLLQLLADRSFKKGEFKLASGATSTYYIDGRMSAVFSKGAHAAAYSGFEGQSDGADLASWLRERDVDAVEVVGIATDHCVRATALDAAREGFATTVRLDLTAGVMQLDPFRDAIRASKGAVQQGETLTSALDGTRRFSVDVIAIMDSGEETGKLPESLERLADDLVHIVIAVGSQAPDKGHVAQAQVHALPGQRMHRTLAGVGRGMP